jgi:hypothetical protein
LGEGERGKERGREYETGKNFRQKRNRLSHNRKGEKIENKKREIWTKGMYERTVRL